MLILLCENYRNDTRIAAVEISYSDTGRSVRGAAYNLGSEDFYTKFGNEQMTFNIVEVMSAYFQSCYTFEVWLF